MPDRLHPHMLRHTRAMHLYLQGMPINILSEHFGHEKSETTKVYAFADTETKRIAIEKADVLRGGISSPVPIWADDEDLILKLSGFGKSVVVCYSELLRSYSALLPGFPRLFGITDFSG